MSYKTAATKLNTCVKSHFFHFNVLFLVSSAISKKKLLKLVYKSVKRIQAHSYITSEFVASHKLQIND